MSSPAPSGDVALLFSDIEGSTALWDACPDGMARALREHDTLFRETSATLGGYEVKAEADSFMIAFQNTQMALRFAIVVQENLANMNWPAGLLKAQRDLGVEGRLGLRVRMGINQGTVDARENPNTGRMDYFGPAVNLAARLCGMAHGAQVIVTDRSLGDDDGMVGAVISTLGKLEIRGFQASQALSQLVSGSWWPMDFPPLRLDRMSPEPKAKHQDRGETLSDHVSAACDKLLAQSVVDRRAGQPSKAERHLVCLEATTKWLDDPDRLFEGYVEKSLFHAARKEGEIALRLAEDAVTITRLRLSDSQLIVALRLKTRCLTWLARFADARATIDEAMQIAMRIGDEVEALLVEANGADISRLEGQFDEAEQHFEHAIEALESQGLHGEVRVQRKGLALSYLERGDPRGVLHAEILIDQYQSLGQVRDEAMMKGNLSLYHLDQDNEDAFLELHDFFQTTFHELGNNVYLAASDINEGWCHLQRGRYQKVQSVLDQSDGVLNEAKDRSEILLLRSLAHLFSGDRVAARSAAEQGLPPAREDGEFIGPMKVDLLNTVLSLARGDRLGAHVHYQSMTRPNSVGCRVAWRLLGQTLSPDTEGGSDA